MFAILLQTLPFFLIIGLGYGAAWRGFFPPEATAWLTRFVFYFALSAMLFRFAANLPFSEVFDPQFITAYLCGTGIVYLLATLVGFARRLNVEQAAIEAQCAVIGNVGFLGVPMLVLLMGEAAIGPVMLVLTVDLIVFSSLVVILITGARDGRMSIGIVKTVGMGLLKNPMIVSIMLGLLWSASGAPIPDVMNRFLAILGGAATPGALFAIGASLAGKSAERPIIAGWLSFCKLVLHPAFCGGLCAVAYSGCGLSGIGDDCCGLFARGRECLYSGPALRRGPSARFGLYPDLHSSCRAERVAGDRLGKWTRTMTDGPRYTPLPLPRRASLNDEEAQAHAARFLELMKTRHSIRDFADRAVPEALIATCIATAGTAPSGANQQPWHFVAVQDPAMKTHIRAAAEAEEEQFYSGGGGEEWLRALEPIGTSAAKPHLTTAPWLIVVFAQRYGLNTDGTRRKHYYVSESVGIATGLLIMALHNAGLYCLTHTPNPMKFLNRLLERPENEKPVMILAVGHAAKGATIPAAAKVKKALDEIMTTHKGGSGS